MALYHLWSPNLHLIAPEHVLRWPTKQEVREFFVLRHEVQVRHPVSRAPRTDGRVIPLRPLGSAIEPWLRSSIVSVLQGASDESPIEPPEILDEALFKRRFGFVWPEADRRALFEMKRLLDLTDSEIRFLHWVGDLKPKTDRLTFTVYPAAALYMGACMWLLCLTLGVPLLVLLGRLENLEGCLRATGGLIALFLLARAIYFVFYRSYSISKRARDRMAAAKAGDVH